VHGALHPRTREALADVRRRGEKAIVLAGRRGWANFLSCRGCGRVWECPDCDVSLVLHRADGHVRCHHCGHAERVPARCPDCGSASVARHGAGTERLEHELRTLLGSLPVLRLDSDVVESGDPAAQVLARFEAAPAAVLVGTGMVAKGHDFPEVTLGVVVDADATLRFPDFRAEERTFAAVTQLAGRSGRGPRGGRVLVQALDPSARALRHAAEHDAEGFLREELRRRETLGYPPFGHLVRIVCSSDAPGCAVRAAREVRRAIRLPGARVLGPAPLFRLRGRERAQVVVKAPERSAAVAAVRQAVERVAAAAAGREVAFAVDVDPH
jgi:primosomal protein N' (replication factor Y)